MLARFMRSDVARWLVVVLIAPLLVLGVLNRAALLAHGHDDHGLHLHPVGLLHVGGLAIDDHASLHAHDCETSLSKLPAACDARGDELTETPCCFIICIDFHKQLPTRTACLRNPVCPEVEFPIVAFVMPRSPDLDVHVGSPGGELNDAPMHLLALRASDRLVRTSHALLI
jgi:hypothetical protein